MRRIVLFLIILLFYVNAYSQRSEIGFFLGGSYYIGDLNPRGHFNQTQLAEGIIYRYNFNPRLALKINAFYGNLKADDSKIKYNEQRELKFQSPLYEVSAQMELNFFKYFTGSLKTYWTPYIFGGVSAFNFKPEADGENLRDLGTEGQNVGYQGRSKYPLTNISFPFGIGFKYSLAKNICVSAEWGLRKTFTDYIDDVSKTYYLDGSKIDQGNSAEIHSDPSMQHLPGMQRGNPKDNDWYSFAGMMLTYKIKFRHRGTCRDFQRHSKY